MSNIDNNNEIKNSYDNDGYTDANDPNAPRKKRRRRPNPENEDQQNNVADVTNDTPKRRHRRKRKDPNNESELEPTTHIGVAAYLEDLQDDIEIHTATDEVYQNDQLTMSRGKVGVTQGVGDTVYVEGTRKFRPENQEKYMNDKLKESQKMSERLNVYENRYDNDLMECVITIAERFRILATFIHAIFAGLVLMYTVFSLMSSTVISSDSTTQKGIFSLFGMIQQPFSIFNYLMFIFIGVSIMDRCDMGQPSTVCNQYQGGIILALVLIIAAFIINNSLYYFNPYFTLYKTNSSYMASLVTVFPNWSIVDAAKSILVCVAWFVIALLPVYDRFVDSLNVALKQEKAEYGTQDRR